MSKDTSHSSSDDPIKMTRLIIESTDQNPAPKRIALGGDAYTIIHNALVERLAILDAHKDLAFSTDSRT